MRELQKHLALVSEWMEQGREVAVATLVQAKGSSPRRAGAQLWISDAMQMAGSVSAGCVEAAVLQAAQDVLVSQRPQLLHFGIPNDNEWDVGLSCGGEIQVFVEPWPQEQHQSLREILASYRTFQVIKIIEGDDDWPGKNMLLQDGNVIASSLPIKLQEHLQTHPTSQALLQQGQWDGLTYVIQTFCAPPDLVIVGGNHIAIALSDMAQLLGYMVTLIDPRTAFANPERFPRVDRLFPVWPKAAFAQIQLQASTPVVLLTHDPKIDDQALAFALDSPTRYIGALGSPKTHARRCERLLAKGFSREQISRIHGPVGLDIGSQTPAEIALSILSEITLVMRRGLLCGKNGGVEGIVGEST